MSSVPSASMFICFFVDVCRRRNTQWASLNINGIAGKPVTVTADVKMKTRWEFQKEGRYCIRLKRKLHFGKWPKFQRMHSSERLERREINNSKLIFFLLTRTHIYILLLILSLVRLIKKKNKKKQSSSTCVTVYDKPIIRRLNLKFHCPYVNKCEQWNWPIHVIGDPSKRSSPRRPSPTKKKGS